MRVWKALLRQLGLFFVSSIVVFMISRALPRTPMEVYLQQHGLPVTAESIEALERQWSLGGPLVLQYLRWIGRFSVGDWGTSIVTGEQISAAMAQRFPISLAIGLGGVILAAALAYPLGMKASLGPRRWDRIARLITLLSQAVPSFLICTLVIDLLGVRLGWIPFYRLSSRASVVAPMLIVAFYSLGQLSRVVTGHVEQLRDEPFVTVAVARGFVMADLLWRDGRRPVLYGLVSALIAKMAWVIGGTAVVEYVFAVPGMSYYLIKSIGSRDYTVVQSYLMVLVLWMFGARLVLSGLLAWLDPRTR